MRTRPALRLVEAPPPSGSAAGPPSAERSVHAEPGDAAARAPRPSLDDLEIVSGVLAGDPSVATAFHDRVRPRIECTILRLLGCREVDHEDLVQNALIGLVDSLPRFRGECSLDTWIARITAHVVWKELRRRTIQRRIFDRSEVDCDSFECSGDLEASMVRRDQLARIRGHLAEIDPVKAWTLMLHDVAGFDLREIAEITDASVAAAQSRLVRGRRELDERLSADPELRNALEDGGVR